MNKLVCMGELLIDFQSKGTSPLKDTVEFVKKAGGAPANVCVQAAKLGAKALYLSMVGKDAFGEFLIDELKREGVDVCHIKKSSDYDTSLAFVSFAAGGERQFAFYRRTAADLHFTAADFSDVIFERGDVFEFGSVALKTDDSRNAHDAMINKAKSSGALVCFDPNLRFNLWEDCELLKRIVIDYAKKSDVIKMGGDELEFVKGELTDAAARAFLCETNASILAITRGSHGAKLYLKDGRTFDFVGYRVNAVDTTGAGDSFFGGLIAELMRMGICPDNVSGNHDYDFVLKFACKCGSYTSTGYGAISAMGNREKISKVVL